MIAQYNRISLFWGVPGLALQVAGVVVGNNSDTFVVVAAGAATALLGTLLLTVGLCYYSKAKGRHPAWGVVGLMSFAGLLVLAILKDHTVIETPLRCPECGYDLRGNPTGVACPECGRCLKRL